MAGETDVNRRVAALADHPAWDDLRAMVQERQERQLAAVARAIVSSGEIDQRRVDEERGFQRGVAWVLAAPSRAAEAAKRETEGIAR